MKSKNICKKHMNLADRIKIENGLNNSFTLRSIGKELNRSHNTISREIIKRRQLVKGNSFNMLSMKCPNTSISPFVCNNCDKRKKCRKDKYFYYAEDAHSDYKNILVDSRSGIDLTCEEFHKLEKEIKDDIEKGHSFAMVVMNNPDIDVCERTLYNYQEKGYFKGVKNIDLPRKVRYKKRKRDDDLPKRFKRPPKILIGRKYEDFTKYIKKNNISYYVQMDTVEGVKGSECFLTFLLVTLGILLVFKLENQDSESVAKKFKELKSILGYEQFLKVFPIILTDRGKEFYDVEAIECNGDIIKDTKLFFCNPGRSDQKGALENLHEYIRRYIPKGVDVSKYTGEEVNLMINHINSTSRDKYYPNTPYELFKDTFGEDIAKLLNLYPVPKKEVILKPILFKEVKKEKEDEE